MRHTKTRRASYGVRRAAVRSVRMSRMHETPTLPPGPADDAALEYGRRLVAEGRDRSAAFWATIERLAAETPRVQAGNDVRR